MRSSILVMLALWAIAFFGSFVAYYLTPTEDIGFTGGLNRFGVFFTWQAVAFALAIVCLFLRWSTKDEKLRRLAAIPSMFLGLIVVAMVAVYAWLLATA